MEPAHPCTRPLHDPGRGAVGVARAQSGADKSDRPPEPRGLTPLAPLPLSEVVRRADRLADRSRERRDGGMLAGSLPASDAAAAAGRQGD